MGAIFRQKVQAFSVGIAVGRSNWVASRRHQPLDRIEGNFLVVRIGCCGDRFSFFLDLVEIVARDMRRKRLEQHRLTKRGRAA